MIKFVLIFAILFFVAKTIQAISLIRPDILRQVTANNGNMYWVLHESDVESMAKIDDLLSNILETIDVPNKNRYKGPETLRQSSSENYTKDKKFIYLKSMTNDVAIHELAHLLANSIGHTTEWKNIYATLFSIGSI
jgi:hypothetical protein